jgi:hypothetical protein
MTDYDELEKDLLTDIDNFESLFSNINNNNNNNNNNNDSKLVISSLKPTVIKQPSSSSLKLKNELSIKSNIITNIDDGYNISHISNSKRKNSSAFELANSEIEKEELQDLINTYKMREEEYDTYMSNVQDELFCLRSKSEGLSNENKDLRCKLLLHNSSSNDKICSGSSVDYLTITTPTKELYPLTPIKSNSNAAGISTEEKKLGSEMKKDLVELRNYEILEFKLAETKAKLARAIQTIEDEKYEKIEIEKFLEAEKLKRLHCEKERDAYMLAYEQSLSHINKEIRKK